MNTSMDTDPLNPYEYPCGYNNINIPSMFNYNVKVEQLFNTDGYGYPPNQLNPNNILNQQTSIENKNENNFNTNREEISSNHVIAFNTAPNNSISNPVTAAENVIPSNSIKNISNVTGPDITDAIASSSNKDLHAGSTEAKIPANDEDSKEHLKPLLKRRKKPKGKVSSYWNKKIEDKNFMFYGCAICNVSFKTIKELDNHVVIHKGRLTSYDLRLKNQEKKKLKKKQAKQLKKLGKLKKEDVKLELDLEIKPEDGYIGSEAASDYAKNTEKNDGTAQSTDIPDVSGESNNAQNNNVSDPKNKTKKQIAEADDPRLEKLFKCFACQKQFALSYYLRLHVRSHTDERPYTCSICGMSFITASKRGRHTKRIHLSVKYTCRICFRYFSRFEYLTRHFDKKHADDKIEGEPYDYNVILPYLKELEEQLGAKNEKDSELKKEDVQPNEDSVPPPKPQDPDNVLTAAPSKEENPPKLVEDPPKFEDDPPKLEDDPPKLDIEVKEEPCELEDCLKEEEIYFDDVICKSDKDADYPEPKILFESVKSVKNDEVDKGDDHNGDVFDFLKDDGGGGDDDLSDEDYFPLKTWASVPKVEPSSPAVKKKKPGRRKIVVYPHKCELCDTVVNNKYFYKMHMSTHSGERPYECDKCSKGFITKSKLCRHLLTHEKDKDEKPVVKQSPSDEERENVDKSKKRTKRTKKSKKLKKLLSSSSGKEVEGFRKRGDSKRPYVCMYCHQRFLHREAMLMHKSTHKNESYKCYFCLEPMPDEATLTSHEDTHTGPKPFVCNVCGRCYRRKEAMQTHKKTHDPTQEGKEKKEFICDVCSKSFNAACKLQKHLVSHRKDKFILKYECPVCAYMFSTKWHIEMHLGTHIKEGLIFEENRREILAMVLQNAHKFPQTSDSSVNLTEIMPADERSRVCNICGQVFQHFYYLEEHLKSHGSKISIADENDEGEKKHICPVCNKGFKLHYYLKLHSFTHSKEKPFICQQCGKGFITKGKLKRHLETHTGLKKFQCHICCKFFTRRTYLRIHIRTIHGTQDYNFRMK